MPEGVDLNNLTPFPKRIPEKLKTIRENLKLTPDDFAPHVNAPNGAAVVGYENGTDVPVVVFLAYSKLAGVPLENLIKDDRDLWFGHLSK